MKRKTLKVYSTAFISLIIFLIAINETTLHSNILDKVLDYVVSPILIGVIFFMLDLFRSKSDN